MPLFHHATALASLSARVLKPRSVFSDSFLLPSYLWWEREFGFYPLFLAIGRGRSTLEMTGYPNQFNRRIGSDFKDGKPVSVLRQKGDIETRFFSHSIASKVWLTISKHGIESFAAH